MIISLIYYVIGLNYPKQVGVSWMLGGWRLAPGFCKRTGRDRKGENMEDKIDALYQLLNTFSTTDKDKILEILRLAFEITRHAASE